MTAARTRRAPEAASCPEAVRYLDTLDTSDPESAHGHADDILLALVPTDVADAYRRVVERCRWWAAG